MKVPFIISSSLIACFSATLSAVDYTSFSDTGIIVTGVRSTTSANDDVVLTASYTSAGVTQAGLYQGSLAAAPSSTISGWTVMNPVFAGQTVTNSTFYGPNTSRYTPSIGAGNVVAVGSYKYDEGSSGANFDHGMIYEGPVSGVGGTWTQIDATPLVSGGATLLNTIAHSNMGHLVVGNYDTDLASGMAFIYNRDLDTWVDLNPNGTASVTAYGIWQNSSTSFTIAGGQSDLNSAGLDEGFLVNYDSGTGLLSNFKSFNYMNQPVASLISHFDGITATADGFNLTGDYVTLGGDIGAFFASVKILPDESFSDAVWTDIAVPGADFTSGNTVVDNSVLGISSSGGGTSSYLASVPEPSSALVFAIAAGSMVFFVRRRSVCSCLLSRPR